MISSCDRMITWTNHLPGGAFVQITTTIIMIAMMTEKIFTCTNCLLEMSHDGPLSFTIWLFCRPQESPSSLKIVIYQRQYLFDVQEILVTLATMLAVCSPQNPQDLLCRESSQNHRTHRRWPSRSSSSRWWRGQRRSWVRELVSLTAPSPPLWIKEAFQLFIDCGLELMKIY